MRRTLPVPRDNVEIAAATFAQAQGRHVAPPPRQVPSAAVADVLSIYQDVGYAWGPTLVIGMLLPVVAVVVPRTRRRRSTAAAMTLACSGLILLVVPAMTVTQDFRYVLPAQALLWPAAALAASALWSPRRPLPAATVGSEIPEPREVPNEAVTSAVQEAEL